MLFSGLGSEGVPGGARVIVGPERSEQCEFSYFDCISVKDVFSNSGSEKMSTPTVANADAADVASLIERLKVELPPSGALDAAAQTFTQAFYESFEKSLALARVYATVPYGELPSFNRDFVDTLASNKGVSDSLEASTPVLSLMGTFGNEADWCDRKQSAGHVGIPLVSSAFVDAIPMVSRMLQQVGAGIEWMDSKDLAIVKQTAAKMSGFFYVPDASTELDSLGRHVIPAQNFVSEYGVKTVFGLSSGYESGTIVVAIIFAKEEVAEETVATLQPALGAFQTATEPLVSRASFFGA
jgi:hypothetical protein